MDLFLDYADAIEYFSLGGMQRESEEDFAVRMRNFELQVDQRDITEAVDIFYHDSEEVPFTLIEEK